MKTSELREMTVGELQRKVSELRRELLTTRIQHAAQQLKNPLKLRVTRREIARILTIMNEKGQKAGLPTGRQGVK
jgi:large subunit ribosomal protein L29